MGNHILDGVKGYVRRGKETYEVDPRVIQITPGWNARTDFSGEEELMESIIAIGVEEPLWVKKDDDGILWLRRGERRLRATLRAISDGHDIKSVPVFVVNRKVSDSDLYFGDLRSNTGKDLNPTDEAVGFKRAIGWGFSVKEIAERTGRSQSHVRNRLELADASPDVKKAVTSGEISISKAQEITKESGGSIDTQNERLHKEKSRPKTKRAVFSFKGNAIKQTGEKSPCEPIETLLSDNDFIQRITDSGYDPDSIRIMIKPGTWKAKEA